MTIYKVDHTKEPIKGFRNEYRWLSNFAQCNIEHKGIKYPTVEHAYQAAKLKMEDREKFVKENPTPFRAKMNWRNYKLQWTPEEWERFKFYVMEELINIKFRSIFYKKLLLDTGDRYIEETNNWGDTYWGFDVNQNRGQNNLGHIIMMVRHELKNEVNLQNN